MVEVDKSNIESCGDVHHVVINKLLDPIRTIVNVPNTREIRIR